MAPTTAYQNIASIVRRDENHETERWIFNFLSLMAITMIVAMTTIRCQQFWKLHIINASRIITVLFYFTSFSSAIVFNHVYVGVGLAMNGNSCKSSILVCITFYVVTKLLLYFFMLERVHTIRAAEYTRLKDKLYVITMIVVTIGSIAIVIYAMYTAQAHVSDATSCRIGLTPIAAGLLLAWDLTINIWLTLLFVSLLLPTLRARAQLQNPASMSSITRHLVLGQSSKAPTPLVSTMSRSSTPASTPPADSEPEVELDLDIMQSASPLVESLERLIRKSLLGLLLIVVPTTVNLVLFIKMDMLESGFQCFLTCLLDITATTMVFHWLTMTPRETHSGTPMRT